jgi:hypothetical protein
MFFSQNYIKTQLLCSKCPPRFFLFSYTSHSCDKGVRAGSLVPTMRVHPGLTSGRIEQPPFNLVVVAVIVVVVVFVFTINAVVVMVAVPVSVVDDVVVIVTVFVFLVDKVAVTITNFVFSTSFLTSTV